MSDQERITELEALNENLAQQIVGFSDRVQESIRPALAKAWDEGYKAGVRDELDNSNYHAEFEPTLNPYKGEVLK